MSATQVSFSAFAHSRRTPAPFTASDQRCLLCGKPSASCECTSPASTDPVPALVAQAPGSGGECTPLRKRRMSLLYERRWGQPKRYVVVGHYPWGPSAYPLYGRAFAWHLAQRYGLTFVDLGATA